MVMLSISTDLDLIFGTAPDVNYASSADSQLLAGQTADFTLDTFENGIHGL